MPPMVMPLTSSLALISETSRGCCARIPGERSCRAPAESCSAARLPPSRSLRAAPCRDGRAAACPHHRRAAPRLRRRGHHVVGTCRSLADLQEPAVSGVVGNELLRELNAQPRLALPHDASDLPTPPPVVD